MIKFTNMVSRQGESFQNHKNIKIIYLKNRSLEKLILERIRVASTPKNVLCFCLPQTDTGSFGRQEQENLRTLRKMCSLLASQLACL